MAKALTGEQVIEMQSKGLTIQEIKTLATQKGYSMPDNKNFSEKFAPILDTIFGGGKIGEAIGTGIAKARATPEEKQFITPAPPAKQVLGDVVGAGLAVATLGGAGMAGKIGARILKTGAIGAGLGAAGAAKEGQDITKSALIGGAVGAGIPIVGAALSKTGVALSKTLPQSIMQSAIGQSKKQLLAGKDVSEFALKKVRFGTADRLIKKSQSSIEQLNGVIQKNLTTGTAPTVRILKNEIIADVAKKINSSGGAITTKEVSDIIGKLAPQAKGLLDKKSMSLAEANRLRSLLDKTLGDRAFLTTQLPFNKDVLKSFANIAREKVKTLAPEGTRNLFSELSKEITFRDAISSKYAGKARNEVINAFDVMIAGGGFFGAGAPGAVAAFAGKKIAQSAVGKTTTAVALNKLTKLEPILQKLAPAERTILLEVLAENQANEENTLTQ